MILLVSGLPRAGTSLTMSILKAAGFNLIEEHPDRSDVDNPNGYHELRNVHLRETIEKHLGPHNEHSALKLFPMWWNLLDSNPERTYRVKIGFVYIVRNVRELARSQNLMDLHRGTPIKYTMESLEEANRRKMKDAFHWLHMHPSYPSFMLYHALLFSNPMMHLRELAKWLEPYGYPGVYQNLGRMIQEVDPALYRNRAVT